jgi:heptosyltransferase-3
MARTTRVLIYRLGSLGDTVVALPAFHLVAGAFPDAERRLLTNFPVASQAPPAAAVLEGTGTVHGYFRYSAGTRSWRELMRLWWQIVRWGPAVLVYLGPARGIDSARRDARFFRLCGIRRLIGVPVTEDMQQNRVTFDPALGCDTEEYEAQRLVRNLVELGVADLASPASWDLRLTAAEHARAASALAPAGGYPILAVSLGTKLQANDWEEPHWRELLGRLAALYPNHALALTGGDADREPSRRAAALWKEQASAGRCGAVLNLCGELTPRETAAVFARARVYIGHDSGPMHLAAAAGAPCIGIFSARGLPRRWFPFGSRHRVLYHRVSCSGCNLETCTIERKRCILSISVQEVLDSVQEVLDELAPILTRAT